MNILNHKKIANEVVKNFYTKKDKFNQWQVTDYDKLTSLVMFNAHSIYRVFKDDFLIRENKDGIKTDTIKKFFDADLNEYKKAENVELKKRYDTKSKKFYTCIDDEVWIDDDTLKYLDAKQEYQFWYKSKKEPIFITTLKDYKVALICPVHIQ